MTRLPADIARHWGPSWDGQPVRHVVDRPDGTTTGLCDALGQTMQMTWLPQHHPAVAALPAIAEMSGTAAVTRKSTTLIPTADGGTHILVNGGAVTAEQWAGWGATPLPPGAAAVSLAVVHEALQVAPRTTIAPGEPLRNRRFHKHLEPLVHDLANTLIVLPPLQGSPDVHRIVNQLDDLAIRSFAPWSAIDKVAAVAHPEMQQVHGGLHDATRIVWGANGCVINGWWSTHRDWRVADVAAACWTVASRITGDLPPRTEFDCPAAQHYLTAYHQRLPLSSVEQALIVPLLQVAVIRLAVGNLRLSLSDDVDLNRLNWALSMWDTALAVTAGDVLTFE